MAPKVSYKYLSITINGIDGNHGIFSCPDRAMVVQYAVTEFSAWFNSLYGVCQYKGRQSYISNSLFKVQQLMQQISKWTHSTNYWSMIDVLITSCPSMLFFLCKFQQTNVVFNTQPRPAAATAVTWSRSTGDYFYTGTLSCDEYPLWIFWRTCSSDIHHSCPNTCKKRKSISLFSICQSQTAAEVWIIVITWKPTSAWMQLARSHMFVFLPPGVHCRVNRDT